MASLAMAWPAHALTNKTWTGTSSTDFEDGGNWSGGTAPGNDTFTNVGVFSGTPTANQPTLTKSRSISGIMFTSTGWTIGGSGFTLTTDFGAIASSGAGTNTILVNLGPRSGTAISVGAGNTLVFAGSYAMGVNSSGATKTGAGTLQFTGAFNNGFSSTKPLTVNQGLLDFQSTTANGLIWAYATGTGTFQINKDNLIRSNSGDYIAVDSSGAFDFNGHSDTIGNVFIGATGAGAGGLGGGSVSIGTGTVTASTVSMMGGQLSSTGAGQFTANSYVTQASANNSTISGQLVLNQAATSFAVDDGSAAIDLDVSATMSGSGFGISKSGTGLLNLSAVNNYTGGTAVTNGILNIASTGSINGTSGVTIGGGELAYNASTTLTKNITFSSGILSGTGTVTSVAAGNSSDAVAPGSSSAPLTNGTLTVAGNFSLAGGGHLAIDLAKTAPHSGLNAQVAGVDYDQVVVTSGHTVDVTGGDLMLTLGNSIQNGEVYYILDNADPTAAVTGTFTGGSINGVAATITPQTSTTASLAAGIYAFTINYADSAASGGGNDISLTTVAVPEPASLGLLFGLGWSLSRRKRRRD